MEPRPRGPEPWHGVDLSEQRNRDILVTLAMTCAAVVLLVSFLPPELRLLSASQFLAWGSFAALFIAALRGERPFAAHLTFFDQASVLLALSLVTGLLADPVTATTAVAPEVTAPLPAGGDTLAVPPSL